jgi:hypothetical protein
MRELFTGFVLNMRAWLVTLTNEGGGTGQRRQRGLWAVGALRQSPKRQASQRVF